MSNRMLRADAEIQKELAEIIKNDLSDPRLQSLISVTSVKTSPDFTSAKVRVSIYEQELSKRKEILKLLQKSSGYIKRILAENLCLRNVPALNFQLDDGAFYEENINKILETLNISPAEEENNDTNE
ncbi:MAG: 30S ribosome-binding factor RbfA [Clostridia bacterium]|nr:30S ribosome-binding factor RbfA [Clostridia bacterium]